MDFHKYTGCLKLHKVFEVRKIKKLAKSDDTEAQYRLGNMYYCGENVAVNYKKAAKWQLQAAEKGHKLAENNLSYLYEHGEGVPKNEEEAVKWLTRSAEHGYDHAQNRLGVMYKRG